MRLRSSGPSPQWLLGICCPLGMQVTLEPRCLCGHGTKCLYYGKDVNALENFAPDRLPCSWCWAEGASGGGGGSCVAENCPVHFTKGKAVPWARLCAAMQAGPLLSGRVLREQCAVTPAPCTPGALGTGTGGADSTGPHRGKWIVAKLSIQQ